MPVVADATEPARLPTKAHSPIARVDSPQAIDRLNRRAVRSDSAASARNSAMDSPKRHHIRHC
jgi:hypothetical protein